jgi:citrate lyase subunit beta/citryl-CoA lyase
VSMPPDLALTWLFVPGNRPERFLKAFASGADRIILDLEDAVAAQDKASARSAIAGWMAEAGELRQQQAVIRINDTASVEHIKDLELIAQTSAPCIMLPKCEAASDIAAVLACLPHGATVVPLIETARGMVDLHAIASAPGVARLAFGSLDYMADLDLPSGSLALDFAAAQIAVASRAAGLATPLAGVTPELDSTRVGADTVHVKTLGFGAKMCIHPIQLAAVRSALAPSAAEVAWAQKIMQAWGAASSGAIQVDGKMVDRPVVLKAERIAALAHLAHS